MVCLCERLLTDEFSCTKLNTFRRLSGSSVTCLVEISCPIFALSVCNRGAASVTRICSLEPTVNETFSLADWPTSNVSACCLKVLKPATSTVKTYTPAGNNENEKLPSSLVLKVLVIPFSTLARVTVALGTLAPEGSETEPENEAEEAKVCAWTVCGATLAATRIAATNRRSVKLQDFDICEGSLVFRSPGALDSQL